MQETFKLRKFKPDDLQNVMQINRVCLPENYTDMFFMDLHEHFPELSSCRTLNGKIVVYNEPYKLVKQLSQGINGST